MPHSTTRALSLAMLLAVAGAAWPGAAGAEQQPIWEVPRPEAAALPPPAPPEAPVPQVVVREVIGQSVLGRPIEAHSFGAGPTHLLLVGGIHGGYEWNSVLLAWTVIDWLAGQPEVIPPGLTVTVIPVLNPDGLQAVVGKEGRFTAAEALAGGAAKAAAWKAALRVPGRRAPGAAVELAAAGGVAPGEVGYGRFNAYGVDLNRNFDCDWRASGRWAGGEASAGAAPFSEPEAEALRKFVLTHRPAAAVFWHSQAGAVYPGQCGAGMFLETLAITAAYAEAAGYRPARAFSSYQTTGDAESWLAVLGIPAIAVELLTRHSAEWPRNRDGLKALFAFYEKKAKPPAS